MSTDDKAAEAREATEAEQQPRPKATLIKRKPEPPPAAPAPSPDGDRRRIVRDQEGAQDGSGKAERPTRSRCRRCCSQRRQPSNDLPPQRVASRRRRAHSHANQRRAHSHANQRQAHSHANQRQRTATPTSARRTATPTRAGRTATPNQRRAHSHANQRRGAQPRQPAPGAQPRQPAPGAQPRHQRRPHSHANQRRGAQPRQPAPGAAGRPHPAPDQAQPADTRPPLTQRRTRPAEPGPPAASSAARPAAARTGQAGGRRTRPGNRIGGSGATARPGQFRPGTTRRLTTPADRIQASEEPLRPVTRARDSVSPLPETRDRYRVGSRPTGRGRQRSTRLCNYASGGAAGHRRGARQPAARGRRVRWDTRPYGGRLRAQSREPPGRGRPPAAAVPAGPPRRVPVVRRAPAVPHRRRPTAALPGEKSSAPAAAAPSAITSDRRSTKRS